MSTQIHFLKRGVLALAAVMLVFPFVAKAEDFGSVALTPPGKVTLTAQAGGFPAKGSSIDAPPGAPITLAWTVPAAWAGCLSNWQTEVIVGNGSKTATINNTLSPRGRIFVMTCYGVGQAQTVATKVNIIKPDLSIAGFTFIGTAVDPKPAVREVKDKTGKVITPGQPAILRNTFKTGTITFKAVLKNSGRTSIPATPAVMVAYEAAQTNKTNTVWVKMNNGADKGLQGNYAIAPGATPSVEDYVHTAAKGGPWYFRVRADSTNVVDEANKNNNTRVIGPFYFVD